VTIQLAAVSVRGGCVMVTTIVEITGTKTLSDVVSIFNSVCYLEPVSRVGLTVSKVNVI